MKIARTISAFSFFALLFSFVSLSSCAQSEEEELIIYDQSKFLLMRYEDGYYIADYLGDESTVQLPDYYEENGERVPVVGITEFAFARRESLDNIYLSNTIRHIGPNAFFGSSLKKVYVTPFLETIDPETFNNSGISFEEKDAFRFLPTRSQRYGYAITLLTDHILAGTNYSVTVPDGCQALYQGLFKGFSGQVFLPSSLVAIHGSCFEDANVGYSGDLSKIRLVGEKAFYNAQCLRFSKSGTAKYESLGYEFRFSNALQEVGAHAFYADSKYTTFLGQDPVGSSGKIFLPADVDVSRFGEDWQGNYELIRE